MTIGDDAHRTDPPAALEGEARARTPGLMRGTASAAIEPALPDDGLILVPVRDAVLFPGAVQPLTVGRARSVAAVQAAVQAGRPIGLLLQRETEVEEPGPLDLHRTGTVAGILRYLTANDGGHHMICQGQQRFRVREYLTDGRPYLAARVERLDEPAFEGTEAEARFALLRQRALEVIELLPQAPKELAETVRNIESAGPLADFVAATLDIPPTEKQEVLETLDLDRRIDRILSFLDYRISVLKLSQEIGQQTRQSLDKRQREAILREQLRTIQRELGEDEDGGEETAELRERLENAGMPAEVETPTMKELRRLERMPEAAAEHGMLRSYLETMAEMPWAKLDEETIDLERAREVLDEDHYGLDKIKRRIVEFLAVRKLAPEGKSPILCFVGPPGVGKTSLGRSIARATGRSFERISLGGVDDESEIRGHRRTYVGAMPGNIVQAIKKAGARNPVLMLDEVDKLGRGVRGDPAAALLEVLDPQQNATFRDAYLGVPFDLSRVLFVATANMLDAIPGPLRDRMEIIELPSYTEEEKVEIARRYLVGRQLAENGLKPEQAAIEEAALRRIVRDHTREAGCRNLERRIGAVLRSVAVRVASGETDKVTIREDDLPAILGPKTYENEVAQRTSVPGVATGLAWTPVGGDILFVEASRTPGSGKLILTGQLGEVMRESAQAALTLLKGRAADLGIGPERFDKGDVHVHVPAGAIPKDGPSAGVAMFTALASLMLDRAPRADVAMSGEISLRGLVLPVGGIKEKVLAAARAGIGTVLLPERNRKEYDEIPETARDRLRFVWLNSVDDAMAAVFDDATIRADRPDAVPAEG